MLRCRLAEDPIVHIILMDIADALIKTNCRINFNIIPVLFLQRNSRDFPFNLKRCATYVFTKINSYINSILDRLGGVMVSVVAYRVWKVVGSIPYGIYVGISCYTLSTHHLGVGVKTRRPKVKIMCPGKVACFLRSVAFVS